MSLLYELTWEAARQDILSYLSNQDAAYFAERGRTREDVLSDSMLIDDLTSEHWKCVHDFGNDREWSCKDACDNDPGFFEEDQL